MGDNAHFACGHFRNTYEKQISFLARELIDPYASCSQRAGGESEEKSMQ